MDGLDRRVVFRFLHNRVVIFHINVMAGGNNYQAGAKFFCLIYHGTGLDTERLGLATGGDGAGFFQSDEGQPLAAGFGRPESLAAQRWRNSY